MSMSRSCSCISVRAGAKRSYGAQVTWHDYIGNEKDVRSLDMPRWMVVGFIPLSFFMMAIEFARFLVRRENFLGSMAAQAEE